MAKAVIIVAPHTSNLDFFVGLSVDLALDLKASFLGKDSIFNPSQLRSLPAPTSLVAKGEFQIRYSRFFLSSCSTRAFSLQGLIRLGRREFSAWSSSFRSCSTTCICGAMAKEDSDGNPD